MAEDNDKAVEAQAEAPKEEKDKKSKADGGAKGGGMLPRILLGLGVVVLAGAAGAGTSLLLKPGSRDVLGEGPAAELERQPREPQKEFEYYPFEAVTVNLNVRSGDRYMKVKMFLAVAPGDKDEVFAEVDKRQKELKNWLMGYLRDHTLEEVSGKRNQIRIQREIAESFNERLWPDGRPRIDHVLFDEFTVQ
ncbi:MAG: flagellar basal body-associated FliL family protein [Phycisphaerae bacterium]|nr:flagellar basal body-associated FliL family protein [Phycisphaerae bacterium]